MYRFRARFLILCLAGLAVVLVGVLVWHMKAGSQQYVRSVEPQLSLVYKGRELTVYDGRPLEAKDQSGTVVEFVKGSYATSELLLSIEYERRLRLVAGITKQDLLTFLKSSSDRTLPQRFKGFHEQSRRDFQLNGKQAFEIVFTYTGPHGQLVMDRLVTVIRDDDSALYLFAQANADQFAGFNRRYFDPMIRSLKVES